MVDENTDESLSDGGEYLGEEEYTESYAEDVVVVGQEGPSQGTSWFLLLSGVGFLMAGVALVFAPQITPRLADIGQALAKVGLLPSTFAFSGIVLFGLGLVARAVAFGIATSVQDAPAVDNSEFMLVADQLATDLAQSRTSMMQISESVAGLEEGQRMLMDGLKSQGQPSEGEQDSVFRLAASMDQLNARLDENMGKLDAQLSARFLSLAGSVQKAVDGIATSMERVQSPAPAPQVAAPVQQVVAPAPQVAVPAPQVAAPAQQVAAPAQQVAAPLQQPSAPLAQEFDNSHAVEQLGSALEEQLSMASHPMDMQDVGDMGATSVPTPPPALPVPVPTEEPSLDFFDEMDQPGLDAGVGQLGPEAATRDLDSLLPDESIRRALGE